METEQTMMTVLGLAALVLIFALLMNARNLHLFMGGRLKSIKEVDANSAVNVKANLYRAAQRSKPPIVKRLVFRTHAYCSTPKTIKIVGLRYYESLAVVGWKDGVFRPEIMLIHRNRLTLPTTPDLKVQATSIEPVGASNYWVPDYCNADGTPLEEYELQFYKNWAADHWLQFGDYFMEPVLRNVHHKEVMQALTGRATEDLYADMMPGGMPQAIPQDEYGQKLKAE